MSVISLNNFFVLLTKNFDHQRIQLSQELFKSLSRDSEYISLDLLTNIFNHQNYPKVKSGKITTDDFYNEFQGFLRNFEKYINERYNKQKNQINEKIFTEMMSLMSIDLFYFQEFKQFCQNCFKLYKINEFQSDCNQTVSLEQS